MEHTRKRRLLDRRPPPSLATNVERMSGTDCASPYSREHIVRAAPYVYSSPPTPLTGLIVPTVAASKPPAARRAPTRSNIFKAVTALSSTPTCNECPIRSGTIVVTHYGFVPPRIMLCDTRVLPTPGSPEVLVPYQLIPYEVAAAEQFTLATNSASMTSLEITSFAAARPLNGTVTAAHVMDLDDITKYSSGTFELRSTTPKDAVSGLTLQSGLVELMGPESWTTTLIHPDHKQGFAYPGYTNYASLNEQGAIIDRYFNQDFPHRWFAGADIQVEARIVNNANDASITLQLMVATGACPTAEDKCSIGGPILPLVQYITLDSVCSCTHAAKPKPPAFSFLFEGGEAGGTITQGMSATGSMPASTKCTITATTADPATDCSGVTVIDGQCKTGSGQAASLTLHTGTSADTIDAAPSRPILHEDGSSEDEALLDPIYHLSGRTSCSYRQVPIGIRITTTGPTPPHRTLLSSYEIATYCADPEHQFGPAHVARLEGITPDIIMQLNSKSIVAGIQTGDARAVAPPTPPSLLAGGDEDGVLTQALFDDASSPISRTMPLLKYVSLLSPMTELTRADAVEVLESAPLGDAVRNIAGTIAGIGRGIGGPLAPLGDIIGTVGNIAGGIGDVIGGLFSSPTRRRLHATPVKPTDMFTDVINWRMDQTRPARSTQPHVTNTDVITQSRGIGWTPALDTAIRGQPTPARNSCQMFPFVDRTENAAGMARIYVTTQPVSVPGRDSPSYHRVTMTHFTITPEETMSFYIDDQLVVDNTPAYVQELLLPLATYNLNGVYVTTDAPAPIYGDSCAAALLAAIIQPTPMAAVTGGLAPTSTNCLTITPVGDLPLKIQAALDEDLVIIAPPERVTNELYTTTAGSAVAHVCDVLTGTLSETPTVIVAGSTTELLVALTFVRASRSTPIGPEEQAAKEATIRENRDRQTAIEQDRREFDQTAKTPQELAELRAREFPVTAPGVPTQNVPLLDPAWWNTNAATLETPPPAGMGIPMDRIRANITLGNVRRLAGIAVGLLSRINRQQRRPRSGGRPQRRAPYKTPAPATQLGELLTRLRQPAREPPADERPEPRRQRTE